MQKVAVLAALMVLAGVAQADVSYLDNTASSFVEYGGTLTPQADYTQLDIVSNGGAYTYGPGKTPLPQNFGTFTQSVDFYVDPSVATPGTPLTWSMEVLLRTGGGAPAGEFDFVSRYLQDVDDLDNDLDTTDWIYKLGRNNDTDGPPVLVETPGWYTLQVEWMDDGVNLTNSTYILQNGTVLSDLGPSVNSPWASSADGYETGYMWVFGRNGTSTTLGLDNVRYECASPVPVPGALVLAGMGLAGVTGIRRRRR